MVKMLNAALDYARRGIPVFPCRTDNKHPITANGFKDATTDEKQVTVWWRQYSGAMIGMACGSPSKLWVLDVDLDPRRAIDGTIALTELTAKHGPLPPTRMSATPRGGSQYFFRWDGTPIRNSVSKLGPGLDVRTSGGYVILPPSIRIDGTPYRWLNMLSPAEAPPWLIHALSYQTQARTKSAVPGGSPGGSPGRCNGTPGTSPRIRAWATAALRIACERIATAADGTCNHTLNAEAFDLFRLVAAGYLDEQEVRARLLAAAQERGIDVEYGEPSVLNTIDSAATAGLAQPRFYPGR